MSQDLDIKPIPNAAESKSLQSAISSGQKNLLNHQHKNGFWWYTLEANDSINAEYIFLLNYLGISDPQTVAGICRWIISNQNKDGSWSLYYKGAGDISATVECYLALKMSGYAPNHPALKLARKCILDLGGITQIRVFSRIHLALFGLVDWKHCPNMPVALIQLPEWTPVNIYEFSSWARACIVPLLVIMDQRKVVKITDLDLDELYKEENPLKVKWTHDKIIDPLSLENAFLKIDLALKVADKFRLKPLRRISLAKCTKFIREHLDETEDIYPAMFYGILALYSLCNGLDDIHIEKALLGLKSFQIITSHKYVPQIPFKDDASIDFNVVSKTAANNDQTQMVYQQCCISPVWDTAWAGVTLLDSGFAPGDKRITKAAEWLLTKQITDVIGDWAIKNPGVEPGGWSFEFKNKHYPDVDDTIEVLTFLHATNLPYRTLKRPLELGLNWLISMQCKNGGFAAFDKDNNLVILNKIPFSDHGACLDPATVDITGRMISFLIDVCDFDRDSAIVQRAADFITERQEKDGSFWGRWGVNYIYGTWCALEGLCALGRRRDEFVINRAVHWLKAIQNPDGGFGESCTSYQAEGFVAQEESTASQTAWALLGLVAAHQSNTPEAKRAAQFLVESQNKHGGWDEECFTGTGFPGHFYIRYHGYRNYFPLMALAKYHFTISSA